MSVFITGTDTNVGKTYFTSLYTRALRKCTPAIDAVALKPVCAGPRDDAIILSEASGDLPLDEVNPVWFKTPAAPAVAARLEGRDVDFQLLLRWYKKMAAEHPCLVVEGVGGWLAPMDDKRTVADLAALFSLPVIVVVANRIGCINHTLLTLQSIGSHGLECAGLVLNTLEASDDIATVTNKATLESVCNVPVLFELLPGQKKLPPIRISQHEHLGQA